MKFESLSLDKYEFAKIQRTMQLKGGVVDSSEVPNGGSSCATGGGSMTSGGERLTWTGDQDVYDSSGELVYETADRENLCRTPIA